MPPRRQRDKGRLNPPPAAEAFKEIESTHIKVLEKRIKELEADNAKLGKGEVVVSDIVQSVGPIQVSYPTIELGAISAIYAIILSATGLVPLAVLGSVAGPLLARKLRESRIVKLTNGQIVDNNNTLTPKNASEI